MLGRCVNVRPVHDRQQLQSVLDQTQAKLPGREEIASLQKKILYFLSFLLEKEEKEPFSLRKFPVFSILRSATQQLRAIFRLENTKYKYPCNIMTWNEVLSKKIFHFLEVFLFVNLIRRSFDRSQYKQDIQIFFQIIDNVSMFH